MSSAFNQTAVEIIHENTLPQYDIVAILMFTSDSEVHSPKSIKDLAIEHGVSNAQKWNISAILTRNTKLFFKSSDGWRLTQSGCQRAESLGCSKRNVKINQSPLRKLLEQIPASPTRDFFGEAICCYENRCYRGAAILAWESSISVLYDYVLTHCLDDFNREASSRINKWKKAHSFDDLANMKESIFLDVLNAISIIGKSTKQELQSCLNLRNGCGHPNTCSVGPQRVLGYMESLWNNVFLRFL